MFDFRQEANAVDFPGHPPRRMKKLAARKILLSSARLWQPLGRMRVLAHCNYITSRLWSCASGHGHLTALDTLVTQMPCLVLRLCCTRPQQVQLHARLSKAPAAPRRPGHYLTDSPATKAR